MKFYDHFAGIGGFHLGLTRAGHECVGACEKEDWKRTVYSGHFPGIKIDKDARAIDPGSLPDFEILCGGFPCQAFSLAGKRKGLADPRGDICFEIARVAGSKKPRILLLENVPGLLFHEKGDTYWRILKSLDDVGYDVSWQVLHGENWLPQTRSRVYIVGRLRGSGQGAKEIFPLGEREEADVRTGSKKEKTPLGKRRKNTVSALTTNYHRFANAGETYLHRLSDWQTHGDYRIYSPAGLARTLQSTHDKTGLYMFPANGKKPADGKPVEGNAGPKLQQINDPEYGPYRVYSSDGLARTLMGRGGGMGAKTGLYAVPSKNKDNQTCVPCTSAHTKSNGLGWRDDGDPQFTLSSDSSACIFDGHEIRRLMPVECERIMGFPDGWTAGLSDNRRYIALGESVMVPIIEHLGSLLNE